MSQEELLIDFCPSEYGIIGGESILVTVCGQKRLPDNAASLFVVFEGTEQRHVSAAHRINDSTLQASIPGKMPRRILLQMHVANLAPCGRR
jgi:hypothetical protein